jgi:hypothetical protein
VLKQPQPWPELCTRHRAQGGRTVITAQMSGTISATQDSLNNTPTSLGSGSKVEGYILDLGFKVRGLGLGLGSFSVCDVKSRVKGGEFRVLSHPGATQCTKRPSIAASLSLVSTSWQGRGARGRRERAGLKAQVMDPYGRAWLECTLQLCTNTRCIGRYPVCGLPRPPPDLPYPPPYHGNLRWTLLHTQLSSRSREISEADGELWGNIQ